MRHNLFYKGKKVFKFDGTEVTKEDLNHLYITDKLSVKSIAFIFGVKDMEIAYYMDRLGVGRRVADLYAFSDLRDHLTNNRKKHVEEKGKRFDEEMYNKQKKEHIKVMGEIEKEKRYIDPSKDFVIVNGKIYVDVAAMQEYKEKISNEVMARKVKASAKTKNNRYTPIRHVDLSAMRLHRGLNMHQFATKSGIPYKVIVYYEKTPHVLIPAELSDIYRKVLNISNAELKKIRECLSGERRDMHEEENRSIPEPIRKYVHFRDGGKCVECGTSNYLHYHHKERFADGGKHKARNLVLLCVGCHAMEHYGEKSFYMLKARAEKLGVMLNVC